MAVKNIAFPTSDSTARSLTVGEQVSISGTIITARDHVHKHLFSGGKAPVDMKGIGIYHCGPVVLKKQDTWKVVAAGPTTSIREEPYEDYIIKTYRPCAIIGKGGMGDKTLKAMADCGCVYLNVPGGAAQYLARCIRSIDGVYLMEFGPVEAMWVLQVEGLPALVTMDSHGDSLHTVVKNDSHTRMKEVLDITFNYD